MKRATPSAPRGFTIHEATVAVVLLSLAFTTVSSLFSSNQALVQDSRAHQRAEAEHRRNLVALSNVFRTVDIQTLEGFNEAGVSTNPHFERVTGADMGDRIYSGHEQLIWMPRSVNVPGISNPGAVYLVEDGQQRLVADRIPSGGFYVRQQGQNMLIHLTTYYMTNTRRLVKTTSDAVVSLRN